MKLSKLAERLANDLCIFGDSLSIPDYIYALGDRNIYAKLLEKYTSEEIKQVDDELMLIYKAANVGDELIYKTANF